MTPLLPLYDDDVDDQPASGNTVWIPPELTMEEVTDLAAGIVPKRLEVMARRTLDFEDYLRRNAEKPLKNQKTKGHERRSIASNS